MSPSTLANSKKPKRETKKGPKRASSRLHSRVAGKTCRVEKTVIFSLAAVSTENVTDLQGGSGRFFWN